MERRALSSGQKLAVKMLEGSVIRGPLPEHIMFELMQKLVDKKSQLLLASDYEELINDKRPRRKRTEQDL